MENILTQSWIKSYLRHHPYLWHFDRDSVSRGVAVGLFTAVVLFFPFQTLIAVFCCILLRANFPVAFLVSWICNPLTILPIAYLTAMVGNWVLGEEQLPIHVHPLNINNWPDIVQSFKIWIFQFGKGYFVGLPIVSLSLAAMGYLVVYFIWNWIQRFFKKEMTKWN